MTSRKTPEGDIESPDASLSHYFDDLLGIGDVIGEAIATMESQPVSVVANAGLARVVNLPTKKNPPEKPLKNSASVGAKPRALAKSDTKTTLLADPVQTPEQKQQLEKLLQSVSAQLLVEAPLVEPLKVATPVTPGTESKTHFVVDENEIQEWDIGTPDEMPADIGSDLASEHLQVATESHTGFKMDGLEWLENGRPQWAQSRFDVLLFKVAGLTLAVPLISLGQIQPLTDELTPLFGQADWFMGLQPTPAGKIRTVNTAKFVMPERYDATFLQTAKYVMSINGVPWGLAVDSVNQPITLQPEDVKWRSDRGKRPWLAGTVKDHMCALLDIPRIGQILVDADKNFVSA
uniref:chemotaxis protein CheW n=1 Tax=Cellvibrio fontiphilus TaxID=1815559 RepID=UPI002B4BB831|nr:chemotaxis protein CheW [Cellvibrio fontiphilus]